MNKVYNINKVQKYSYNNINYYKNNKKSYNKVMKYNNKIV